MQKAQSPTTLVIFGATGDLSRRKLIPAFFDLFIKSYLPEVFRIVGFSRSDLTHDEFRKIMNDALVDRHHEHSKKDIDHFLKQVFYQQGLFHDASTYEKLAELLIEIDSDVGICSNKLLYLAVPPTSYETIFQNLADSGLSIPCAGDVGWTHILVEKPFGKNLETAQKLDRTLGLLFKEEQVFRIDHYLAKETIQNILAFRFSNSLFEPIWNANYIERIELILWEKDGVENRGAFYDSVGALRDVGQNHLLQMLALIAMDDPGALNAEAIRQARAQILLALTVPEKEKIRRGQYRGFKSHSGVEPDSSTETYFQITTRIDTPRWKNIPFMLESGKKMKETKTEIRIYFKEIKSCICHKDNNQHYRNILTLRIQPNEGISIVFWAKQPGFDMKLEPKILSFSYASGEKNNKVLPDAYEKILFDCINGDQTLFASTNEVNAAWEFVTPISQRWDTIPLKKYDENWDGKNTTQE